MEKIRKKSSGKWAGSVSLWLILCLACLLLLSGGRKKEEVHPTAGEDGVYQIYYLNSTPSTCVKVFASAARHRISRDAFVFIYS